MEDKYWPFLGTSEVSRLVDRVADDIVAWKEII